MINLEKILKVSRIEFITNLLLFTGFFTFYYIFVYHAMPQMITNEYVLLVQACFTFSIAIAILIFSRFKNTFSKNNILFFTVFNILTLIIALFIPIFSLRIFCIILIGVFFGISQLSAYMYFANTTKSEARGRIGGIIGFITLPVYFIASNFLASNFNLQSNILLCIILSSFALLASFLIKNKSPSTMDLKEPSYFPEKRTIIYYALPWIVFSLN